MKKTMVVLLSGVMLVGLFAVPAAADENAAEAAPGDSEEALESTAFTLYDGPNYTGAYFHRTASPGCFTLPTSFQRRADSVRTSNTIGLCTTHDCRNCLVIAGDRTGLGGYTNNVASVYVYY